MPDQPPRRLGRTAMAAMIDATLVRAQAVQADIVELCNGAVEHGFAAITVNPAWVSYCARRLRGASVKVACVIGFPLGAGTARIKIEEAREALQNGAGELEMVMNIGALRSGYPKYSEREIAAVAAAAGRTPLRVIVETSFLTQDEKILAGELCARAGAAGVQTATGYGLAGADVEDIKLMREATGGRLLIKAAGGIRTYGDAMTFIKAGAGRIGASAAAEILAGVPPD